MPSHWRHMWLTSIAGIIRCNDLDKWVKLRPHTKICRIDEKFKERSSFQHKYVQRWWINQTVGLECGVWKFLFVLPKFSFFFFFFLKRSFIFFAKFSKTVMGEGIKRKFVQRWLGLDSSEVLHFVPVYSEKYEKKPTKNDDFENSSLVVSFTII